MAVKIDEDSDMELQMTPLIDMVFLLLIFFLVSSQMKRIEKELPIELPEATATMEVKSAPNIVTVSIDAEGQIYIGSEPVGNEGLRVRLRDAAAQNPEQRIRVAGDVRAPFGSIVHVLDVCQGEGLNIIGINTRVGSKK